jgi:diadenosine tetraphosphate (Ap4A) HIT family hydrolase
VSETGCVFCTVVTELQKAETYQHAAGAEPFRKIHILPTSIAILGYDQYYPGYTLVISKTHATELYQLSESESTQYFKDMLRVAQAVATAFQPRKMNYELLGNTIMHLHWHLLPRYGWDPNPKRPVWEQPHTPKILSPQEYTERIEAIRRQLS